MGAMDERSNVTSMVQSPTSRFTAVNSTNDPLQTGGRAVMNNVNIIASGRERHEKSSGQQRFAQGTQEKIPIMTISANQHENWARLDKTRERNFSILPNPSSNANVIPIPHVNKQLKPEEIDKRPPSNSMGPNLYHQHPLPPSAPLKFNAESGTSDADLAQEENLRQQLQAGSRETYTPPGPQFRHAMKPNEERESTQDSDKWGIGEVLHRASGGLEVHGPQQPNFRAPSSSQDPVSQYSQGESKKRKRNFSNRTKTGCMTCRRRKKKCDETKPECNNCLRGGFTCSGYQQRVPWLKPESNQGPIPLQSKKEYENSPYSTTKPYPTTSVVASPRNESASTFRGQALRIEQQYMRPLGVNSDQRIAPISPTSVLRTASENQNISSNPCTQPAEVLVMATNSAYPDHHSKKVHDRKHDETRQAMHRPDPEMNTTPSVKNPPPSNSPTRGALEDPLSSAQQAAQLALLNLASTNRRSRLPNDEILPGRPTQKEEMLAGRNYYPSDTQLVLERESCISACWRFNNSANPNYQVSPDERARLFRDILHAHEHVITPNQTSPVNPSGSIGENVVVDIPFYCDYGYNISIGQDVVIGRNCTIIDTCEVSIGDRCHLGPNVSLYTETLPIDPKRRLGSRGPHTGREIVIQSDCWIGGNVIILPGRTIGKGATVGAGSVVTRDIPSYTVACGNPARILRGVANND